MDVEKDNDAPPTKSSFASAIAAVAWGFFGVRKSSEFTSDVKRIKPIHLALAALGCAGAFVGGLILLVQWVIQSGVAK